MYLSLTAYAAFSGDYLELSFALPFIDFLPPIMELKFRIQVHDALIFYLGGRTSSFIILAGRVSGHEYAIAGNVYQPACTFGACSTC